MKYVHEFGIVILCMAIVQLEAVNNPRRNIKVNSQEIRDRLLYKRSLPKSTVRGAAALLSLLRGAKQKPTTVPNTVRYVKYGNLKSAMEELTSLKHASEIQEFGYKKGKILIRHVGDRQFTLYTVGDRSSMGNPFVEVKANGYKNVRIVYGDKRL